jgi:hypothetical protein
VALEDLVGTKYIDSLVSANPVGATDPKSEGDDHIRGIKNVLKTTFPSISGAVTSTHTELNILDGVTSTAAELNILDGVTSTAAELNILDGATATAAEINALDADQVATTPTVTGDDSFIMDDADVGTVKIDIDNVDTYLAASTKTLTNKSIDSDTNTITNLDAATIDFTLATGGSWSITSGGTQVIPAGLYMATQTAGTIGLKVDINQGASWRAGSQSWSAGLFISDGTNVRISGNGSDTSTVYYRELA